MKIRLDADLCQGHGICVNEAPELFRLDDDGAVLVLDPEPPESQRTRAERAVRYCPTFAISLES